MTPLLLAFTLGGACSFLLEVPIRPRVRPPWRRPKAAMLVHLGSWCLLYAGFLLLVQRPWFASVFILCLQLVLLQSHHVKWCSLKEPFLVQDFEYFLDAIRHPRLYLPFFGIWLASAASLAGAATIAAFVWWEPWWPGRVGMLPALATLAALLVFGIMLLQAGLARLPAVSLQPTEDLTALGLYAYLWSYARQTQRPLDERLSPASFRQPPTARGSGHPPAADALPHVVAVQSESFFDPRRWSSVVRPDVLPHWDRLKGASLSHGPLTVPAWGANTVRTEAAFLSGLTPEALGIYRFNPYRQFARQPPPNLLRAVKQLGYHCVAIHPYPASFYLRDRVLPALGIDEFLDIRDFDATQKDGQYIGDAALTQRVAQLLESQDSRPLFILVITMENHGPLHLESPQDIDWQRLATEVAATGVATTGVATTGVATAEGHTGARRSELHELAVYLRHLCNADHMLGALSQYLTQQPRGGLLCWYGDHVPIMDKVYGQLGDPAGTTDYLIWSTRGAEGASDPQPRDVSRLGVELLERIFAYAQDTTPRRTTHSRQDISPSPRKEA